MDRIDILLERLHSLDTQVANDAIVVSGCLFDSVREPSALELVSELWPDFDVTSRLGRREEERLVAALRRYLESPVIGGLKASVAGVLGECNVKGVKPFLQDQLAEELGSVRPNHAVVHQLAQALEHLEDQVFSRRDASPYDFSLNLSDARAYLARLGITVEEATTAGGDTEKATELLPLPEAGVEGASLIAESKGTTLVVLFAVGTRFPFPWVVFHEVRAFRQIEATLAGKAPIEEGVHPSLLLLRGSRWVDELRSRTPRERRYEWALYHYQIPWSAGLFEVIAEGWSESREAVAWTA